ncbi:MAG: hypothetical protein LUD17_11020 [Bacteroidales bacterium]|nr:hypothetical protein [Bacteroidales bacterium]
MTENSLYDKKSLFTLTCKKPDWKEIVKDVVSYSNAEGGIIEYGLENDSTMPAPEQRVTEEMMVMLTNNVNGKANGVMITTEKKTYDNGGETILLNVRRSRIMATTSDGKVFMRNGDNSEPISGEDLHRLAEDKGCYNWETSLTVYTVSDCDNSRLASILRAIRNSDRVSDFIKEKTDIELMRYFALIGEDNEFLTNLGVVFIGTQPQRQRIPNSPTLQCLKFDEYGEKINKWTWDDCLLGPDEIIEKVWATIPDWKESQEVSDGLFRRNVMSYDEEVIRELLSNAIVHRSYAITGDIFLNIHPDHIEIVNPGRLPFGVTPENILHKTKKRNPNYANLMRALKYMDVEGSGYDKMYEVLLQQGKHVPIVKEGDDFVSVKVGRRIQNSKVLELMAFADKHYQLRQKQNICLGLIAMHESLTARELEKLLELTDSEALRPWLQPLVKQGLVITTNVRSRGIEYRTNSLLLQNANYRGVTSLKRIEDYRLKELIIEDLKLYKSARIGDMRERIGSEISEKRIKTQILSLEEEGIVGREGSNRWTSYYLISIPKPKKRKREG